MINIISIIGCITILIILFIILFVKLFKYKNKNDVVKKGIIIPIINIKSQQIPMAQEVV